MRGLTWVRCYVDDQNNQIIVALRCGTTGFDVLITLLKTKENNPVTKISKSGIATISEATKHFDDCCGFYNGKGYHNNIGIQRMMDDLLNK